MAGSTGPTTMQEQEQPMPDPRKASLDRQVAAAFWKFRILVVAVLILAVFEASLFAFGVLSAFGAVLLFPLGFVLYLGALGLRRVASGWSWSFRFGMRHLMMFVVLAAVVFQLMRNFGWSLPALLAMMAPPVVGVAVYLLLSNRRSMQQEALISVLGMAARRGMPLGPAAWAYAGLCGGGYRSLVEALAGRLDAGESLPDALVRVPGVLSGDAATLARVGWESGTLGPALDEAASSRADRQREAPSFRSLIAYPLLVVLFVLASANFLLIFMIPHFDNLLIDMKFDLPEPSRTVFEVLRPASAWLRQDLGLAAGGPGVAIITSVLLAIPELVALSVVLVGGSWLLRRLVQGIIAGLDRMEGLTVRRRPLASRLGTIRLRREGATVLRALSMGVDGGRPLPELLAELGRRELGFGARWRVRQVHADVERGRDWIGSLRDRGLIDSSTAAVLESSRRAGNLGWALRERADAVERRLNYRLRAWGMVLQPLAIVGLGLLVLLFAVAYFHPLVAMIAQTVEEVA